MSNVTYEIGLSLKEIGFNEPCHSFGYLYGKNKIKIVKSFRANKNSHWESDILKNYISIPTYEEAFKWFRDTHNLHGHVKPIAYKVFELRIHSPNEDDNLWEQWGRSPYDSHEEAETECIKKLIEIVLERKA